MKVGWEGYFENNKGKKNLYCVPCGGVVSVQSSDEITKESEEVEKLESGKQGISKFIELLSDIMETVSNTHTNIIVLIDAMKRIESGNEKLLLDVLLHQKDVLKALEESTLKTKAKK